MTESKGHGILCNEQRGNGPSSFPWFSLAIGFLAIASGILWLVPAELVEKAVTIGDGETARVLAAKLRELLLPFCAIGLIASAASWILGARTKSFYDIRLHSWLAATIDDQPRSQPYASLSVPEHLFWAGCAVIAVLTYDWRTLFWGFFESDDYSMVEVARDGDFPGSLLSTHNDHVLPLLRLEFSVLYEMFGTNPFAYNLGVIASFSLMLYAGCILARECSINRIGTLAFLFLCINWSLWGEFTAGSYILQKYMQITTCGLLSCWCWIRWEKTQRPGYFAGCVFAVLIACLMNPSGYWVPCAVLVFASLRLYSRRSTHPVHDTVRDGRSLTFAVIGVVALSMAVYRYAYSLPGNNEFLTLTDNPLTLGGFVQQLFVFVSTLIATVLVPLPHHFDKVGLLVPSLLLFLVAAGTIFAFGIHSLKRELKATAVALVLVLLGITAMVCLGRPIPGINYIVASKYLGPAYVWLCLIASFCIQGLWNATSTNSRSHWRLVRMVFSILAIALLTHGAIELGARAELPFLDRDVCRNSKLREQIRERNAIGRLRSEVIAVLEQNSTENLRLPNFSGDSIAHALPELAFPWGERPSLRMLMPMLESKPRTIRCLPLNGRYDEDASDATLRESISPSFFKQLQVNELLREIAFAPVDVETLDKTTSGKDGDFQHDQNSPPNSHLSLTTAKAGGSLQLRTLTGPWNPTSYPILRLKIAERQTVKLNLVVNGEFDIRVPHSVAINSEVGTEAHLNLAPLFEYSCSGDVRHIEFVGEELAKLSIESAELGNR